MSRWPRVRLGDVVGFTSGGTPSRATPAFYAGDIQWVTGADLGGGRIQRVRSLITPGAVAASATSVVPAGTVLLVTRTSVGKVAIAHHDVAFSQDITALRPDSSRLHTGYLTHFLRTQQATLSREARGATIQGVTREVVASLVIPLPPVSKQRRIAEVLDRADALRAKRREALALLDDLTQSIFLDMFGHPSAGDIRWPTAPLGEVARTTSGGTPSRAVRGNYGGQVPWVKSGELHGGVVMKTEEHLTERGLADSSAKLMPAGTVLVAMYGATAGVIARLGIPAATNQAICSIEVGSNLDPEFLRRTLKLPTLKLLSQRVGGAQPNLSQGAIRALRIPIPPVELQQKFAGWIRAAEMLSEQLGQHRTQLDCLFASLQQRAFAGQL